MSAPAASRKPPLPALTGLRTLLALSIVFFHFRPPDLAALAPIIDNGYLFVGYFFLMSGYILSYNYADRADLSKRDFWLARFSRLYPVYLLALAFSWQMLRTEWNVRSRVEFWQGVVLTPLLLQGWVPDLATFWNTVAWTLSCEIMLYLAFPYLIRISLPRQSAKLVGLFLGIWIVGLTPYLLYAWFNPDHLAAQADRYTSTHLLRALKYSPPSYICTFLGGLTLGRLQAVLTFKRRQRAAVALAALASIGLVLYIWLPHLPYVLLHGGLLLPLFGALTIGLSGQNPVATVFAFRPLVFVGRATFCLYLLHFNVFMMLESSHAAERLHVAALDPWLSYGVVIALALLAHQFVEIPARKWILLHFGRKSLVPPADGPDESFSKLSYLGR